MNLFWKHQNQKHSSSSPFTMNSLTTPATTTTILLLTLIISCLLIHSTTGYEFAAWGKPCKSGSDGSLVRPHEECDQSKGILCQRYDTGELCGCQISSVLTYDRSSRECRRKVGSLCQPPKSPEHEQSLPFNHKCHSNAECIKLNSTSSSGGSSHVCLCKDGYYATSNFEVCVSKNGSPSSIIPINVILAAIMLSFSILFLNTNTNNKIRFVGHS